MNVSWFCFCFVNMQRKVLLESLSQMSKFITYTVKWVVNETCSDTASNQKNLIPLEVIFIILAHWSLERNASARLGPFEDKWLSRFASEASQHLLISNLFAERKTISVKSFASEAYKRLTLTILFCDQKPLVQDLKVTVLLKERNSCVRKRLFVLLAKCLHRL